LTEGRSRKVDIISKNTKKKKRRERIGKYIISLGKEKGSACVTGEGGRGKGRASPAG